MLASFYIVGTNVFVILILIIVGFMCGKIKIFSDEGIKSINSLMLNVVTPCVIINALQREFEMTLLINLLLSMGASVLAHAISYVLGLILIRDTDKSKRIIKRFAAVFSNCGFMALPLIEAICGSEGLFYGAGFLAVFNILVWSMGQYKYADGSGQIDRKKIILNPGVLSTLLGLILFFTSTTLPQLIISPMQFIAGLNTPVPMMIIGYTISKLDFKEYLNIKNEWITLLIRLVVSPSVLFIILYVCGMRGTLLTSTMISASAPIAAITTMFAIKFDKDSALASRLVAISSLFSIITMTVLVAITKYLA